MRVELSLPPDNMSRSVRGLHASGRGLCHLWIALLAVLDVCCTEGLSPEAG